MTAKEFLEENGIPNMPTQFTRDEQTEISDTVEALEAYHQAKLKLLGIADVVGQSKQSCDCKKHSIKTNYGFEVCTKCGNEFDD